MYLTSYLKFKGQTALSGFFLFLDFTILGNLREMVPKVPFRQKPFELLGHLLCYYNENNSLKRF